MENTYIKLHRKFINWEWFTDSKMTVLFIYLLVMASYKDNRFRGYDLKRGQLITGRKKMSVDTGLNERSIRTCLKNLKKTHEITIKATSKFSIITIVNYDDYQNSEEKATSKKSKVEPTGSPANDQQVTTLKKGNNISKEIVSYLNGTIGSNYSSSSKNTLAHINARINEGRTLDDFKRVIDVKSKEWLNNPKMQAYLRPDTLFGVKMESYLNQVKGSIIAKKDVPIDATVEVMFPEANQ